MKLLVDAHCFDYDTSEGINTHIKGLYGELIKIAHDIDFYFAAHNVERLREIFGNACNVHYIRLTAKGKVQCLLTEYPSIIKQHGIDVAHYQYTSPPIKNCFTIVTLHDILFKDYPKSFPLSYRLSKGVLFKMSACKADMLLTVSEYSRERISHHYRIPKDQIFVTPNAVSEDFFNIDKAAARTFVQSKGIGKYILYVSRIEPRKCQITVLQAYDEMKLWQQGYDLVFIGRKTLPTPNFDSYLQFMDSKAVRHVHIYNQVDYKELKLWYGATSLFIYPALAEGFGIPPIEAGAAGVPCICNNKTAMRDFTFFGDNLIDTSNRQLLHNAILRNINFICNTKAVSNAIKKKYNWQSIAHNFYQKLKGIE